ncbi:MAG: glycosyl hydrolase, partial [Verrucomicrobiales bacterium]|nr:glycosyl hydrolase [Verrucomicrobiales bacterium]
FSGEIDCIHGINWLPFTPAALYMGRHPSYVAKNHAKIVEVRKGGRDYSTGWGDLVCMFNALVDPASSVAYLDENPQCKLEAGNTHAFMCHWVQTLERLGLNDTGVTADHPLTGVFNRDGKRTYVVYNGGGEALEVKFSDGKVLRAAGGGMTVE